MLMVGVWRHGHGAWDSIQKDPSLELNGKFFLDDVKVKGEGKSKASEKKVPNASHLIRRTDYLLGLLHDFADEKSNDSSNRKPKISVGGVASGSSTKKPRAKKVKEEPREDVKPKLAKSKPISSSKGKAKVVKEESSSEGESDASSVYDSMDDDECKESLRTVKQELKRLQKSETTSLDTIAKAERIALYKECLSAIGARIEVAKRGKSGTAAQDSFEKHLCSSFVCRTIVIVLTSCMDR